MMSLMDIDGTTTVGDVIGALSEEEAACFQAAFGEEILETVKDQPVVAIATGFGVFPLDCLTPENAIGATIALTSLQAGGFSSESMACLVDTYTEHGVPDPAMGEVAAMRSYFYAQICLTDEEAMALQRNVPAEDALPLPSQLRCVAEQTDLENLFKILEAFAMLENSTEIPTPDPELMMMTAEIMAASGSLRVSTLSANKANFPGA